ncbi:MAG TPA: NUDIX domain-containing protein [Burkholderiales bacterium]|nr:NUDIX domain-containing protein [Burkholderiales bacterium]
MPKILSAGVIPARRTATGWRLLVLRAFRNWDFPKGVVKEGEEPAAAAVREAEEEAGLSDLKFAFGDTYRETLPYAGGKVARYYIAATDQERIALPVSAELGKAEHHEARWVNFVEAAELLPPRLKPILEWAQKTLEAS